MTEHPLAALAVRVGCDVDTLLARIAESEEVCAFIADRFTRGSAKGDGKLHLLAPPQPVSPLSCRFAVEGDRLMARYPEPNETMRAAVKELGWHWDWGARAWVFNVTNLNGPAVDRLVEAACTLLAKGFIVSLPSAETAGRVERGEYEPRQERWITRLGSGSEHAGWLYVSWGKKDDLYGAAKDIHGARYLRPFVAVPPESYDEVLDFAEQYGYSISEAASKVIEEARRKAGEVVVVKPPPLRTREGMRAGRHTKPKRVEEAVVVGIDDELLDAD